MFVVQNSHIMVSALPPIDKIKAFFPKHRICLVRVLLLLLTAIFDGRTVNLNKCKSKVGSATGKKDSKLPSIYTRFIRFFKMKAPDTFCVGITMLILSLMELDGVVHLVVDRTNWQIGAKKINVLCLGFLLPNKVFIPIFWEILPKKGNSCQKERVALMQRFQSAWPASTAHNFVLLGDREFVGLNWFTWLFGNHLSFVIRLRWQDYFGLAAQACNKTVFKLECKIRQQVRQKGFFQCPLTIENNIFYMTILPNTAKRRQKDKPKPGDDFVVLISPFKNVTQVSQAYRLRWGIEVFFKHVKQNGFNLEDLNLDKPQKVQLMFGVVAIIYCLCIRQGLHEISKKSQKLKKHGYFGQSLFRNGYDNLQNTIHNLYDMIMYIFNLILKPYQKLKLDLKSV
jgi:Transposase DDE domain